MTVHLIVGLPGAGKTTRAKELEASESALRLTPDDWLLAMFDDGPNAWRARERSDQRDRLEGKLVEIGMRAAQLGANVVLDFGFWGTDERSALRWIAASVGSDAQVVYLPVDLEEQRRRIADRRAGDARQWEMTDDDLVQWRSQFQVPDEDELRGGPIPDVPDGYADWADWAAVRWPSYPGLSARPESGSTVGPPTRDHA